MEGHIDKHPLLNPCVLGRLVEFANFESLKTSRLVCHAWNTVAGYALRKRAIVNFNTQNDLVIYNALIHGSFDENSKKLKNLYILVPNDLTWEIAESEILVPCGNYIERLSLRLSLGFHYDETFAITLASLPLLEHLDIHNYYYIVSVNDNIFRDIRFPKLKSCTLRCENSFDCGDGDVEKDSQVIVALLKSCEETLRKLELKELRKITYKEIFRQLNLKSLTHLTLGSESSEFCKIPINILQSLPTLCPNLEYMEYWFPSYMSNGTIYDILSKMKNIRSVKLISELDVKKRFPDDADAVRMITTFPTLPSIKSLSLSLSIDVSVDVGIFASALPEVNVLKLDLLSLSQYQWQPMVNLEELFLEQSRESEFSVSGFPHKGLTSENFPRLTKLDVRLMTGDAKVIFANLQNLKELVLIGDCGVTDVDMTGIEDLELANQGRIVRTNPYIGDLKKLQILYLGFSPTTVDSIKFGIADLESLTKLTIQYPKSSLEHAGSIAFDLLQMDDRYRIPTVDEVKKFDLEPLMLPRVKYLVELILIADLRPCVVDSMQLEDMKRTRPGFSMTVHKFRQRCERRKKIIALEASLRE